MGNSPRKIWERAPRYVLNAGDEKIVRVAPKERRKNQVYNLEIVDISETGMSFIVNWSYLPRIGEVLKVEFPVPGEQEGGQRGGQRKVAWFAKVVRMEGQGERPQEMTHFSGIKVGVEFLDMPQGHMRTLHTGLNKKTQDRLRFQKLTSAFTNHKEFFRVAAQLIVIGACAYGLYWFFDHYTQPDLNYDVHRPVNWGERFFDKMIKKER